VDGGGWSDGCGVDEASDEVVVGEEVLAEGFFGGEAAVGEELLDVGEGLHGRWTVAGGEAARAGRGCAAVWCIRV
jgi:hypothetical protein